MSNRTLRVNELIQRELSAILRKNYQAEAAAITISAVDVAPDLRDGLVWIAVLGDTTVAEEKLRWLKKRHNEIREELGRRIVLKYMPKFTFRLDQTTARGNRVLSILDEIGGSPTPGDEEEEKRS
ncbi:MAG: 30S ribosome-binding factor RbfA [Opitutaceae bacterium]|nr:30S ribosome-binding factor RbfA [Opitutaceae bacterium]